jgi:hypothetical protein
MQSMSEAIAIPGYSIERKLGRGGMAAVYLAIQQSFQREVALKVMSPLLNSDPSFTTRFMREARIVAHMHHASIVPVFDVGEHQPHHYLSMEYLSGGDLKQRILQGTCNAQFAVNVCIAVSSALDLAHRKGFIHRDVKPENILFREDGTPVLTDFGIARSLDAGTSLTMAGMLVGTPSYMSPEQVKGLEVDGRSDLYSLGIVLYEMLTGGVPFRADSTLSVALKHLTEPLPKLPPELAQFQPILDRMTAKERDARFATGADVVQALREVDELPSEQTLIRPWPTLGPKAQTVMTRATQAQFPAAKARKQINLDPRWWPWIGVAVGVIGLAVAFSFGSNDQPAAAAYRQAASASDSAAAPPVDTSTNASAAPPVTPVETPTQQAAAALQATTSEESALSPEDPAFQARVAQLVERNKRLAGQKRLREEKLAAKQQAQQEKEQAEQAQIAELLAKARSEYSQGFMVEPEGASAADRYRAILKLRPDHSEALAGLQRIGDVLAAEAAHAASTGNLNMTGRLIALLRSVQPKHPRMDGLLASLSQMQAEPISLTRRQQENLDRASRYIGKAHEFLAKKPMNLRMAEAATDQYDKATAATPLAPGLPFLKERIIAEYAAAVRTELADEEKKRAQKMIAIARERGWLSPELEQLEEKINAQ